MPTHTSSPASGASYPVGGSVGRTSVNQTFSNIRSGAGNYKYENGLSVSLFASTTTNQFSTLTRGILCFDTSSLPDDAVILTATLRILASVTPALGSTTLEVCSAAPASTSALANSDYGTLGTTSFGSIALASLDNDTYNDIPLNSSGISAINKGGTTQLGLRLGWDLNNSFTGTWGSGLVTACAIEDTDHGYSNPPSLVVSYSNRSGGNFLQFF